MNNLWHFLKIIWIIIILICIFSCYPKPEQPNTEPTEPTEPEQADTEPTDITTIPSGPIITKPRVLSFSGYNWIVKSSETPVGPGPNYFSDSDKNVWVDSQGQLHLQITEIDGIWYCAEVICENNFGYGKYVFYIASKVEELNENVVAGFFTWDDAPEYYHREIDIELSRWSQPTNQNAQYVTQPWDRHGNIHRFNIQPNVDYSTHSFIWETDRIFFQSLYGNYPTPPDDSYIIESWNYTGENIPVPGNENARINLWLFNGVPPSDGMESKIIITKFEFLK